jgi:hypothetical protein
MFAAVLRVRSSLGQPVHEQDARGEAHEGDEQVLDVHRSFLMP